MKKRELCILPRPKKIVFNDETMILTEKYKKDILDLLSEIASEKLEIQNENISFNENFKLSTQGYVIDITKDLIQVQYRELVGAFYAIKTLKQIIQQYGSEIPCMYIEDEPDISVRGVLLDISRDKIPTMETTYKMIDFFADLKVNHIQLYIERVPFAYPSFKDLFKR